MTVSRHLFLLSLGLCLVASHSISEEVKVYGIDPNNPFEDVSWQLKKQRTDKQTLETSLQETSDPAKIKRIEKELDRINAVITKMELKFRVVYKDHIAAIRKKTQNFEDEKAKMKTELKAAQDRHAQAVAEMQEAKEKDLKQIGAYQAKLEESTNQIEKLQRDYAALKEIHTQKLEKENGGKEQLIKAKDEFAKKQNLYVKAMEAMSMCISRENVEPKPYPHLSEIKALRQTAKTLNTYDKKKRVEGLTALLLALQDLYELLYQESNLPDNVSHTDMAQSLVLKKINTENTRNEQINRRTALVEQIMKKNLEDDTEEKIEALKKINEEIDTSAAFLREISRQKAYLRSIRQVAHIKSRLTDTVKHIK